MLLFGRAAPIDRIDALQIFPRVGQMTFLVVFLAQRCCHAMISFEADFRKEILDVRLDLVVV